MQGADPSVVESIRTGDLENAAIDEPTKALLKYCGVVTKHSYKATPEDVENLRQLGWSDEQIAETVYVAALFAFFNRVADAFGLEDPGFIEMAAEGKETPIPAEKFKD